MTEGGLLEHIFERLSRADSGQEIFGADCTFGTSAVVTPQRHPGQSTTSDAYLRFTIFMAASFVLLVMSVRAALIFY